MRLCMQNVVNLCSVGSQCCFNTWFFVKALQGTVWHHLLPACDYLCGNDAQVYGWQIQYVARTTKHCSSPHNDLPLLGYTCTSCNCCKNFNGVHSIPLCTALTRLALVLASAHHKGLSHFLRLWTVCTPTQDLFCVKQSRELTLHMLSITEFLIPSHLLCQCSVCLCIVANCPIQNSLILSIFYAFSQSSLYSGLLIHFPFWMNNYEIPILPSFHIRTTDLEHGEELISFKNGFIC
jgi:hypothetical protein